MSGSKTKRLEAHQFYNHNKDAIYDSIMKRALPDARLDGVTIHAAGSAAKKTPKQVLIISKKAFERAKQNFSSEERSAFIDRQIGISKAQTEIDEKGFDQSWIAIAIPQDGQQRNLENYMEELAQKGVSGAFVLEQKVEGIMQTPYYKIGAHHKMIELSS